MITLNKYIIASHALKFQNNPIHIYLEGYKSYKTKKKVSVKQFK